MQKEKRIHQRLVTWAHIQIMSTEHKDRRRRDAKTSREKKMTHEKQKAKKHKHELKFMEMYRTRVYELRT
jgi:hypothetical protein